MGGDVEGAAAYPWDTTQLDGAVWRWPVVVSEVLSPRLVRLQQPLRVTIHPETPARVRQLGPSVYDSGVEGLTIENVLRAQTAHNEHPGSNGVCFQAVHDCWATDVHVLNADVAFPMTSAKSCMLSGISVGGCSLHHFTITRTQSHDNLVEDFVLEDFTVSAAPAVVPPRHQRRAAVERERLARRHHAHRHVRLAPRSAVREPPHEHHAR